MNEPVSDDFEAVILALQDEIRRSQPVHGTTEITELRATLARVVRYQQVNSHPPIGWPVMPKALVPKLTAYAQKVTRRLLRWYINPLVDQQNLFNRATVDMLAELTARVEELAAAQSTGGLAAPGRSNEQTSLPAEETRGDGTPAGPG